MEKKILAGLLSAALLCSAIPAAGLITAAEPEGKVVYSADFEGGETDFSSRDDDSTTKISDTEPHEGSGCLECSGRTQSWNGPQLPVDTILEKNTEYIVSAWVRTQWYGEVCLSLQYTDSNGEDHYSNLTKEISQGDWIQLEAPISLSRGMTNVCIYFECNQTDVSIFVDDFTIVAPPEPELEEIPSLKTVYSPYFKMGTATTVSELAPKAAQNLIKKHFNSLTAGNELKPDALLNKKACQAMAEEGDDTDPQISLASARDILDFANENNISVRGHVLVWHSQTPDWFFKENYSDAADAEWASKETMLKRMENYIKNVFTAVKEEYPDVDFYAWDVVNEAWSDDGKPRQPGEQGQGGSEKSAWVQVFGDNSFIEPAFEYARKYAPEGCKLYYNDYNEYMTGKTNAIIEMASGLKEKGLIDGIGMQSHLDVRPGNDPFPSLQMYENAMKAFCETGLDIQVTELDATIEQNKNTEEAFKIQGDYYKGVLEICRKYADNVSAVVFWGTTDDKSWRNTQYPLLFNGDFTAKPAYYSIIEDLDTSVTEPTTDKSATKPTTTKPDDPTSETTNGSGNDFIPGDINADGAVNVFDAVALRRYLLSKDDIELLLSCDVTGDGLIMVDDLVLLSQFLTGKDVELKYYKGE